MLYINGSNHGGITRWFKEIFRVHSREEYAGFFTRGFKKNEGTHDAYPWFYSRVFLVCLALFALFAFVSCITFEGMSYMSLPTIIFLGSIVANVPILVFLYEVYPKRDFSFFELLAFTVICSAVSNVLIELGYFALSPSDPWLSILWTAFLEETGKALPVLAAIFIFRKRDPLQCLVIAASAGIGMAVCEDMGYIFYSTVEGYADMGAAVTITVIRAVTAPFAHVLWTGFIGWAFAKFRRPLVNVRFWGMYILSMALHYLWDFPETSVSFFTLLLSLVGGIALFERIVKKERFLLLTSAANGSEAEANREASLHDGGEAAAAIESAADPFGDIPAPASQQEPFHVIRDWVYNRAGIAAAVTIFALSVIAMIFCVVCVDGGPETAYYQTAEEFKSALQCGRGFDADLSRDYEVFGENYSVTVIEGRTSQAVQRVKEGDYFYYYTYNVNAFGYFILSDIEVEIPDTGYRFKQESLYDGERYVYFFNALPYFENCYYDSDYGEYVVETVKPFTFNKDKIIVMSVFAGLVAVAGVAATVVFYVLRKKQN